MSSLFAVFIIPHLFSCLSSLATRMNSSSHVLGSSKNLSGTKAIESGWTDYLGSWCYEDEDCMHKKQVNHKNTGYGYGSNEEEDDEGESDDSMVSDASSGPSHSELPSTQKKAVFCSSRKDHKFGKQRDEARIKVDREECMVYAKSAASHNGLKVQKTKKMEPKTEKV